MALKDLTTGDFEYWKRKSDDMRRLHEMEFLREIDPGLIRAFYRGLRVRRQDPFLGSSLGGTHAGSGFDPRMGATTRRREDLVTLSRIFTATNTVLPNLYWQNPRKIAVAKNGTDTQSAALMTAVQNHYMELMDEHGRTQKHENQDSIMDTWFFGLGWKKVGYHMETVPRAKEPESELGVMDRTSIGIKNILGVQPDQTEARLVPDQVRYERLYNTSESPLMVYLDDKADVRNFRVITHHLKRTLHDLKTFGNYDQSVVDELGDKFGVQRGTRFSDREIELDIFEMMMVQRNGIWILTFADQFDKPLRYDKSTSQGRIPWSPLIFTYEPGVRYPVSHMKVAVQSQEWIDRITNLILDVMGKHRSQHIVNRDALMPGEYDNFQKNVRGGVLQSKRTLLPGDVVEIKSSNVQADLFTTLTAFQQNVTEILGADEQRISGKSKNRTLGQDELAAVGTQVREGGLVDKVRNWMIHQSQIESEVLKQYSNGPLHVQITKRDFADPLSGAPIENKWVEFFTENQPLPLRQSLEGEFGHRINIYEAIKPDKRAIKAEIDEAILTYSNPVVRDAMLQEGIRIRLGELARARASMSENIDIESLIEELDPEQQAAAQVSNILMQSGGVPPRQQPTAEEASAFKQEESITKEAAKAQSAQAKQGATA